MLFRMTQQLFWIGLLALQIGFSGPAQASFYGDCVLYGQVRTVPTARDSQVRFDFAVRDAMPLRHSHARCGELIGEERAVLLDDARVGRGEWLLLRYVRQDGLCSPQHTCASERWTVLLDESKALSQTVADQPTGPGSHDGP